MKKTVLIIAILLLLVSTSLAKNVPDMGDSAVTIPWDDFKSILEKLQQPDPTTDPEPPVDYALGRGALTGVLDKGRLELTAKYPLSVLKKGWVQVPLVNASSPLADVLLDGKTAPVTDSGGNISLIIKGPASHTLSLRFRAAATMRPGPGTVSLQLPRAAGQVLEIKTGEKLTGVTVDGATMSQSPGGNVTAIMTGDSLTCRYTVASEKKQEKLEKLPAKVLVENSTLVSIDEGFIRAIVQLAYEVRHAPVSTFTAKIPEGFDVADCVGASLVGWKLDERSRILTATVGFEVKGAYSLTVVLERSTKNESFSFPLPGVQVQNVERERGFFAVQVTGGVEVTPAGQIQGLQVVDAKELPSGLRGGATNPIVLSFKYLRHPFTANLKVVRHKTQPVLGAAIDSANYVVQLTRDGDSVTRAVYTVRNNRKQFLELALPQSDKIALWSSFVADKPVRPSKTKEGKILLPLEKSGYSGSELSSFTVEVIYYSNLGSKIRGLGMINISLPEVDLPISKSMLTVFAPQRYAFSRIGGSMQEQFVLDTTTSPLGGFGLLPGKFEEVAKEAPAPPPPSKKAKLLSRGDIISSMEQKQAEAEQVFQTRIRAAQQAQDQSGALPARFSVPQQGRSYRFNELITIGEASSLKMGYASRKLFSFLTFICFFITAAMAWFASKLIGKKERIKSGRLIFILGVVAIVALTAAGVSIGTVIGGAVLGIGGRFVRWVVGQIMLQTDKSK